MDQKFSIPVRRIELVNENASPLAVDDTNAVVTMNYTEYAMHNCKFFMCEFVDGSLADNASLAIVFKTGNDHYHILPQFALKAAGHLKVMENATWVASTGAQLPAYNRNRNCSASYISSLEENAITKAFVNTGNIISNPTTITGGTKIFSRYSFSDKKSGVKQRSEEEIILATNTKYAFVLKADAGTNAGQIILNWYEH